MKKKIILTKDRIKVGITLTLYQDLIEDLETIAERGGFTNYKSLIRKYIGQGLREDLGLLYEEKEGEGK
jgi:hypothetical protein